MAYTRERFAKFKKAAPNKKHLLHVYMQGSEAYEFLDMLDDQGISKTMDALADLYVDYNEYRPISDKNPAGSSDTVKKKGNWVLTYNHGLGYIALAEIINEADIVDQFNNNNEQVAKVKKAYLNKTASISSSTAKMLLDNQMRNLPKHKEIDLIHLLVYELNVKTGLNLYDPKVLEKIAYPNRR